MSFPPATSATCLYCHQPAELPIGPEPDKRRAGKCPECSSPHHVWCWHVQGGCSKPGCVCNPRSRVHGAIPYLPARVHELYGIEQGPESAHVNTERWTAFEKFETEYATHSDRRIAAAWDPELFDHFQPAEKYRADAVIAKRCVKTLDQLVSEYRRQRWQGVVDIYESQRDHLDFCSDFLTGLKAHVEEARKQIDMMFKLRLKTALDQNDDEAVEKILSERGGSYTPVAMLDNPERVGVLTADERQAAALALERLTVIREIKTYMARKDTQDRALALYDGREAELHLADSKALTKNDRTALYDARRAFTRDELRQAVTLGDDDRILLAATAALAVGWTLPDTTLDRVRLAAERKAARDRVARATDERELLIAYDEELLSNDRQIGDAKREAIADSMRVYKPLHALRRALERNDLRAVALLTSDPSQAYELVAYLDDSERSVVARVQEALLALEQLRTAIAVTPRTGEVLQQIVDLCGGSETMQTLNLLMSPFEKEQVRKALATFAAVDEMTRLDNAPEMAYIKLAIAKTYHKAIEAGVVLPGTLNWSKIRTALEFETRWSTLTTAIEAGDERAIFEAWNPVYLHEGLELLGEKDKEVLIKALQNTSRRQRLADALASNDAERVAFARRELLNWIGNPELKSRDETRTNKSNQHGGELKNG